MNKLFSHLILERELSRQAEEPAQNAGIAPLSAPQKVKTGKKINVVIAVTRCGSSCVMIVVRFINGIGVIIRIVIRVSGVGEQCSRIAGLNCSLVAGISDFVGQKKPFIASRSCFNRAHSRIIGVCIRIYNCLMPVHPVEKITPKII